MRSLFALLMIAAVAEPAAVFAEDQISYPARRAGLWELSFSPESNPTLSETMQQCVDAESDQMLHAFGGLLNAGTTCKSSQRKDAAGLHVENSCTTGTATRHVRAVFSGDFNASYTIRIAEQMEGGPGTAAPQVTLVTASWRGPCNPGQRPGDFALGGKSGNVIEIMKAMQELNERLKKP